MQLLFETCQVTGGENDLIHVLTFLVIMTWAKKCINLHDVSFSFLKHNSCEFLYLQIEIKKFTAYEALTVPVIKFIFV